MFQAAGDDNVGAGPGVARIARPFARMRTLNLPTRVYIHIRRDGDHGKPDGN